MESCSRQCGKNGLDSHQSCFLSLGTQEDYILHFPDTFVAMVVHVTGLWPIECMPFLCLALKYLVGLFMLSLPPFLKTMEPIYWGLRHHYMEETWILGSLHRKELLIKTAQYTLYLDVNEK